MRRNECSLLWSAEIPRLLQCGSWLAHMDAETPERALVSWETQASLNPLRFHQIPFSQSSHYLFCGFLLHGCTVVWIHQLLFRHMQVISNHCDQSCNIFKFWVTISLGHILDSDKGCWSWEWWCMLTTVPCLGGDGRIVSSRLACATQQGSSRKRKPGWDLIYSAHRRKVRLIYQHNSYLCVTNYSSYVFSHLVLTIT